MQRPAAADRSEAVFQAVLALWRQRLAENAPLPPGLGEYNSAFPWAQVKRGLAALVQPIVTPPNLGAGGQKYDRRVLALVCAGNTPLLAWPAMLFAVRYGVPLFVKMSRSETLWPRLLKESVEEVSPEAGAKIELGVWPGEDERTEKLVELSDAAIAYGSDKTIERLKNFAGEKPFLGFGHALSVGIWRNQPVPGRINDWVAWMFDQGAQFALDAMLFDQSGCLSPQVFFVEGVGRRNISEAAFDALGLELNQPSDDLFDVGPRQDAALCRKIREIQDLARMGGAKVRSDSGLRWTVIQWPENSIFPEVFGAGLFHLIPLDDLTKFGKFLGPAKGRISSVGVAGEITPELRAAIEAEGVSRICRAGEMQTPPLNWRNGGVDLEAWIAGLRQRETS